MANYEATRYNFDGANLTEIEGVNTGIILPWSDATPPSGFLECDGSAVSRSTYANLFAIIGITWGIGDGSTTFNIPDLEDRCCVNTSPNKAFATTGGANTVAVTGSVAGSSGSTALTTANIVSHSHTVGLTGQLGPGFAPAISNQNVNPGGTTSATGGDAGHTHSFSGTFAGSSKSVLQPYLTIMYIIKT
jgi:microcystin-dependent protein